MLSAMVINTKDLTNRLVNQLDFSSHHIVPRSDAERRLPLTAHTHPFSDCTEQY